MFNTLCISHNIFLTREQRYSWFEGKEIEVIGVSIPVWYKDGDTSEPAIEVFSKYKLINKTQNIFVKHLDDGYEITAPKIPVNDSPCIRDLLDLKDKGSEWFAFRQYSKIKNKKQTLNLAHFVEIKDIVMLENSLV